MSTQYDNSFLPSGAINLPMLPDDIHNYLAYPHTTVKNPSFHRFPLAFEQSSIMSPPKTRCGSANNNNAMLVENWSAFVQRLRDQFQGERAHLRADRDRMEEIIEGERELWDQERKMWNTERKVLRTRITELETKLLSALDPNQSPSNLSPESHKMPVTRYKSSNESTSNKIPQESGRNADGSPFYAPAPQNPTRTFDPETTSELRVDDQAAPLETAIRVASKELTLSDFVQQRTPPLTTINTHDMPGEVVDISHIEPELDGVSIRVSAVSPTFITKSLLPQTSPLGMNCHKENNFSLNDETEKCGELKNIEKKNYPTTLSQPENKRLTLFAGHTPNHYVSKLDLQESASSSPAQASSNKIKNMELMCPEKHEIESPDENSSGDNELNEPLGLVNVSGPDNSFLTQLTEKLTQEARKVEYLKSPSESGPTQIELLESPQISSSFEDEEIEGPTLKMKPSINFGRPFGAI